MNILSPRKPWSLRLKAAGWNAAPVRRVLAVISIVPLLASAAEIRWDGTGGNNAFNNAANWRTGVAPRDSLTADIAVFDLPLYITVGAVQPRVTASQSVAGLEFATNPSMQYNLSGSSGAVLTIGTAGISNVTQNPGTQTISVALRLGEGFSSVVSNGTLVLSGGIDTAGRTLTLGGYGPQDPFTGGSAITGVISGTGGLTKTGVGTWTLLNSNTFTGDTVVNEGTLRIRNETALAASTYVGGAGTLSFSAISSANIGGISGSGNLALANDLSGGFTLTVGANNASTTYSGTMSGTGNLIKTGTGTLTLAGTSSYTGTTTVDQGTIALTSANTLASSTYAGGAGTLSFGSLTAVTLGGLSSGKNFALQNASGQALALTIGANNADTGYGGTMSGSGSLTKTGTGTLTLGNAQTYTGTTTIEQGAVRLIGSNVFAANTVTVEGGTLAFGTFLSAITSATLGGLSGSGSFALNNINNQAVALTVGANNANTTWAGNISGSGSVTKTGTGTLTLTGTNSYTGTTTVNQGTLELANANTIAGSTYAGGAGTLSFGTLTAATLGGLSGAKNFALQNASGQALALTVGANNADTTYAGTMSGSGSLIKTGTGTLTLNAAQTYTGATLINQGAIALGSSNVLAANTVTIGGGTLQFGNLTAATLGGLAGSGNLTLANAANQAVTLSVGANHASTTYAGQLSGNGGLTKIGNGILTLSGNNNFSGTTRIEGGAFELGSTGALGGTGDIVFSGSGKLRFTAGNTLDYASRIVNSVGVNLDTNGQNVTFAGSLAASNGGLTKFGEGTLTLSGANAYTGQTGLIGGVLSISSDGNLGQAASGGAVTFLGGTLQTTASFTLDERRELGVSNAGGTIETKAGTTLTYGGKISNNFGSDLSGDLYKTGEGTLVLKGTTGGGDGVNFVLKAGTLEVGSNTALYSASDAYNNRVTFAGGNLRMGGSFDVGAVGYVASTGTINTNGFDSTWGAGISGGGTLTKTGAGTLTLGANDSVLTGIPQFTGTLNLNGGKLAVASDGALGATPEAPTTGKLAFDGGTLKTTDTFTLHANRGVMLNAGGGTIETNAGTTLTYNGVAAGVGGLTKTGGGELELTGANTYAGGTSIDAGIMRINNTFGSAFGSGAVTVGEDAMLMGNGSFSGSMLLQGTLAVGNSVGMMTTGSQTWAGGAGLLWEINDFNGTAGGPAGWDFININGSLDVAAMIDRLFMLRISSLTQAQMAGYAVNFDATQDYAFTFLRTTGGISHFDASLFAFDLAGFQNPYTGTWSIAQSGNDLLLRYDGVEITPPGGGGGNNNVPDTGSSLALLAVGLAGLLIPHRLRRVAVAQA